MSDSVLVEKIGNSELVAYLNIWFPPIGRDTVIRAYASDCLVEHDKILILGRSIDTWGDAPLKPCGWFHDRMDIQKFQAVIDVTSPVSAKTIILAKVDPRTMLPHSIVNVVVRNLAGWMLYFFQQKAKEVAADPKSEIAQRIRANPLFYKHWLLPKLTDYCKFKSWEPVKNLYFEDDANML